MIIVGNVVFSRRCNFVRQCAFLAGDVIIVGNVVFSRRCDFVRQCAFLAGGVILVDQVFFLFCCRCDYGICGIRFCWPWYF